jgi:hypothetical protein
VKFSVKRNERRFVSVMPAQAKAAE